MQSFYSIVFWLSLYHRTKKVGRINIRKDVKEEEVEGKERRQRWSQIFENERIKKKNDGRTTWISIKNEIKKRFSKTSEINKNEQF